MKPLVSPTSPYVRKVRTGIIKLGREGEIEEIEINPLKNPTALTTIILPCKVSTFALTKNITLIDRLVICCHLSGQQPTGTLLPTEPSDIPD